MSRHISVFLAFRLMKQFRHLRGLHLGAEDPINARAVLKTQAITDEHLFTLWTVGAQHLLYKKETHIGACTHAHRTAMPD